MRRRLEQYVRGGEQRSAVKPPFEKEVNVDGRRLKVRIEEVEAWKEQKERKERLVVRMKAKVIEEEGRETIVEKEAKFYKTSHGRVRGYVGIDAGAGGGREADYQRTAAVLKALGIEKWRREERSIQLAGGALEALLRLEPLCAAMGICQRKT